jgi:hypothetical protein
MTEYDTTEKLERTDKGFRLTVESTRGTGTRDQDKVKAELRTEEKPSVEEMQAMTASVNARMTELRQNQPDEEE